MSKKSVFDLDPEQLNQLLSIGKEPIEPVPEDQASSTDMDQAAQTASLNMFIEKPGDKIGRYKLLSVLGEGGMGMVYLAEQEGQIRRKVALKVIKPGMDSKRVIARFEAERQALALLDHPNIAQVYDVGTTESGRPYFVMEYVKGSPITEYCDRHKLSIENRLTLFQDVCAGLQHAHQKGIIHRDIKPSNILISAGGDKAIPKIIDFGVAKAIAQPLTERTLATEESQLLGTPEYMSPEQADMASEDVDTRSDIYSLGVLLYVLLTGALPFDSDTLRTGGIERIRQIIRETDPKTPSTRLTSLGEEAAKVAEMRSTEVSTLTKHLKNELEWIPLKAMRKERSERYRSASELADDIENYLNGAPLIAGPPSRVYRLKKFIRRNQALVSGLTAVLVVLIGGIITSTLFAIRARQALSQAQAVCDFLEQDVLSTVSYSRAQELDFAYVLDMAAERLEGKFKNQPLVEASIRNTLGWKYRNIGQAAQAKKHLERAYQIFIEKRGEDHSDTVSCMERLGWVYLDLSQYAEAAELFEKILTFQRCTFGDEDPATLRAMDVLAIVYKDMGRYAEAEQLYDKCIPAIHRVYDEKDTRKLFMIGNLGQLYEVQGRYNEAELQYLETLQRSDGVWDDEDIWKLIYRSFLARVYRKQGRYEEAERLYIETLPIQRRTIGDVHPWTLWSVNGLAWVYMEQGRFDDAEKLFTEAVESTSRVQGQEHKDTLHCTDGLAILYTKQKRYDEAEQLLVKALKVSRRRLGKEHPMTLTFVNDLAVLFKEQGAYAKAEPLLLEALEGRRLKLGNTHPHTIESWNNLIDLYHVWGKPEQAEQWKVKLSGS